MIEEEKHNKDQVSITETEKKSASGRNEKGVGSTKTTFGKEKDDRVTRITPQLQMSTPLPTYSPSLITSSGAA